MAFWGGSRIAEEIDRRKIVTPFDPKNIDCNSYTLCMGDEYYITPEAGFSLRKSRKKALTSKSYFSPSENCFVNKADTFTIPPGQFAFLLSLQSVKIPDDVMGFISLRSGLKFRGLINVSGFHVDPGFEGKLIYSVFNAGPSSFSIGLGDPLFKLWLADLDGDVSSDYVLSKEPQAESPNSLVSDVAKSVSSVQQMDARVKSLETKYNISIGVLVAIPVLVGLFFGAARFFGLELK